jgi:hypothetical protein
MALEASVEVQRTGSAGSGLGGYVFVNKDSKLWCVLERSGIHYQRPSDVHRVLGVAAAKSAISAPCISVRKYLVDNVCDGSGKSSDQHNTLLLDIAFLHALLEKRAQTRALWRGKSFSDIATLQVQF